MADVSKVAQLISDASDIEIPDNVCNDIIKYINDNGYYFISNSMKLHIELLVLRALCDLSNKDYTRVKYHLTELKRFMDDFKIHIMEDK